VRPRAGRRTPCSVPAVPGWVRRRRGTATPEERRRARQPPQLPSSPARTMVPSPILAASPAGRRTSRRARTRRRTSRTRSSRTAKTSSSTSGSAAGSTSAPLTGERPTGQTSSPGSRPGVSSSVGASTPSGLRPRSRSGSRRRTAVRGSTSSTVVGTRRGLPGRRWEGRPGRIPVVRPAQPHALAVGRRPIRCAAAALVE
jgi:hypothetical protein